MTDLTNEALDALMALHCESQQTGTLVAASRLRYAAAKALPALVAEVKALRAERDALRAERDALRREAAAARMIVAGMTAWANGEPSTPPVAGQPKRTLENRHD